ncbi:MAG: hypothetical protein FD167_5054, partial [bacterium]
MAVNFNNNRFDLSLNLFNQNRTNNTNQSSKVDSIGKLSKATDLLSLNIGLLPSLSSTISSLTPRAGFPENPLSFDNIKYLLKLVAGTIPLTSKLTP